MSRRGIVELHPNETRVLAPDGVFLVTEITAQAVTFRSATGDSTTVSLADLGPVTEMVDGQPTAMHTALRPYWDLLSPEAQAVATLRLEVVLEILTCYRFGFPALAVPGEPREVFARPVSLTQKCESMARQLSVEFAANRHQVRRVARGELVSLGAPARTTIIGWVRAFESQGVWGLVDRRARRVRKGLDSLDDRFKQLVQHEVSKLDGDVSALRATEIRRRVQVAAKKQGVVLDVPERRARQYVNLMVKGRGKGTRAQRSLSFRDSAGYRHYPALRPGQVIAIDVTRVDVLVWDPVHEKLISVEVITAIDVATRCILALRVVPQSANAIDAAMLMYDVMRPFSMLVEGSTVSDWRWAGIPEAVAFCCDNAHDPDPAGTDAQQEQADAVAGLSAAGPLQGVHRVPSVRPTAVRCDHGSIFVGGHFTKLLQDLQIDLLLSRGKRPTDNVTIERWHETIQDIVQRYPG